MAPGVRPLGRHPSAADAPKGITAERRTLSLMHRKASPGDTDCVGRGRDARYSPLYACRPLNQRLPE